MPFRAVPELFQDLASNGTLGRYLLPAGEDAALLLELPFGYRSASDARPALRVSPASPGSKFLRA
jgi:hypothetical protein